MDTAPAQHAEDVDVSLVAEYLEVTQGIPVETVALVLRGLAVAAQEIPNTAFLGEHPDPEAIFRTFLQGIVDVAPPGVGSGLQLPAEGGAR